MQSSPLTKTLLLTEPQLKFIESQSPVVVFQAGAGSGKTFTGCYKALLFAIMNPGSRGMVVGSTFPSVTQAIIPNFRNIMREMGIPWEFNQQRGEATFPQAVNAMKIPSQIWVRSAERPESLLGADLAWCYGDEVGLWRQDAYRYLQGRLRQPGPWQHQSWFTYTPKGRNWAYETLGTPREGLEIIRSRTMDNLFVDAGFMERLEREYGPGTRYWRQEVEGEFVAWEGLVYPDFERETHVATPPANEEFVSWVAGVDWGWSNPGCWLKIGVHKSGVLWVTDEIYEVEKPIEWWMEQFRQNGAPSFLFCDPAEPSNIDHLQRRGFAAVKATNDVLPGLTAVGTRFATSRLMISPACPNLIRELGSYSYKQSSDNEPIPDQPEKKGDHACDALRYGVQGLATAVKYRRIIPIIAA